MTESVQTDYPEIKVAAKWWADIILGAPQDNGDAFQSGFATALGLRMPHPTPEQAERFRELLETKLMAHTQSEHWRPDDPIWGGARRTLAVDYHPCALLDDTAKAAGIDVNFSTFPMKTVMWIDPGKVEVRCGYGAPIETLFPPPA
jgi:hypothetical protein